MTSKTITDCAGDTLRLSTGSLTAGPGEITVKVTERFRGREAVAAVHVDPVALRAALDAVAPAGSYTRTDEEGTDTRTREHLLAEEERLRKLEESLRAHLSRTINRAEKAEQERDHLATVLATTARQRDEADKRNAHPLTPHAITDEMVERARKAWHRSAALGNDLWRDVLTAAIGPARPEGAEEIEALVDAWKLHAEPRPTLPDFLAERGVRVVTEEQP